MYKLHKITALVSATTHFFQLAGTRFHDLKTEIDTIHVYTDRQTCFFSRRYHHRNFVAEAHNDQYGNGPTNAQMKPAHDQYQW